MHVSESLTMINCVSCFGLRCKLLSIHYHIYSAKWLCRFSAVDFHCNDINSQVIYIHVYFETDALYNIHDEICKNILMFALRSDAVRYLDSM